MRKRWIAVLCLAAMLSLAAPVAADGQVTDTLTVKVGYYGMQAEDFVQVGSYHWSELYANLPLHQCAYSFFRQSDDGAYYTVIDSAYGFYIQDLFDYAGVYSGDIQSVQFYTKDQTVGYFTSFTYADLFQTQRYFFNDLAAHIQPVYNDSGTLTGFDANEAWSDCSAVQPMLALEDSWVTYEIGTEHTAPNFTSLGTGNRFRLLFGQSSPMESRTNQSAKYTHTVYITLQGSPELQDGVPQLDGTIGSHTIEFDVTVGNAALLDALESLLEVTSSDASVLEITGVSVMPSSQYSDVATVSVSYSVHREGEVSVSFGFGGVGLATTPQITTLPDQNAQEPGDSESPDASSGGQTPTTPGGDQTPMTPGSTDSADGSATQTQPDTQSGSLQAGDQQTKDETEGEPVTGGSDDSGDGQTGESEGSRVYTLSNDLAEQLKNRQAQSHQKESDELPVQTDVTALTIAPVETRLYLLLTGGGTVLFGGLGAISAAVYYHHRRSPVRNQKGEKTL